MRLVKRLLPDLNSLLFLFIVVIVFLHQLFWPQSQLLITPSLGHGDSTYFSIPIKYLLWQNLQIGKTPIWSKDTGNGFPVLGEGQIGDFYFLNQILFRFPNFVIAYNLSLVLTVMIFSFGCYFWFKSLKFTNLISLFAASALTCSGLIILHLEHQSMLEGFSLLPWVQLATLRLPSRPNLRSSALLAFVVGQQIFTGYPQTVFISLLISLAQLIFYAKYNFKTYLVYGLSIFLAMGIGAIQLLPSLEFQKQTTSPSGFSQEIALEYSFPANHLLTFLNPFILGSPKKGTYTFYIGKEIHLFWENVGYFGVIPLILTFLAIFIFWRRLLRANKKIIFFWALLIFVSFLLMIGYYSPLYWVSDIWPFSWFRVPSRYIWIFTISLVIECGYIWDLIQRQSRSKNFFNLVMATIMLTNLLELYSIWKQYNIFYPADKWLMPPQVVSMIRGGRIFSDDLQSHLNQYYTKFGYSDPEVYHQDLNQLTPDAYLLWHIPSENVYAGRLLARHANVEGLAIYDPDKELAYLDLLSVKYLVTDTPLVATAPATLIGKFSGKASSTFVYQNTFSLPRTYLSNQVTNTQDFNTAMDQMYKNPPVKTGIVTEGFGSNIEPGPDRGTATIILDQDNRVNIQVNTLSSQLLILTDTYYPGWKAFVDNQQTKIFPANVANRSVLVPPGKHLVRFIYQPDSLYVGSIVTIGSIIIEIVFLLIRKTITIKPKYV